MTRLLVLPTLPMTPPNKYSLEKPVVLVRRYKNPQGRLVSYPQCKVVQIEGKWAAYRDVYPNKSELFRDRAWNIDHIVLNWLKKHGVNDVFYYDHKNNEAKHITVRRIDNALRCGRAKQEKLNNHTQIFVPRYLWSSKSSWAAGSIATWIPRANEIDVSQTENKPIEDRPILSDYSVPADTFRAAYLNMMQRRGYA